MRSDTRELFTTLKTNMAATYGVDDVAEQFNVTPSVEQKLHDAIVDSNPFLQKINVVPVDELQGEKVFLGVSGSVTGRTNVKEKDREPRNVAQLDNDGYQLYETDSDVCLTYAQVDTWAKFKDFSARYSKAVQHQIGVDRVKVGWYGKEVATETNPDDNPLLEDVNKGWLQIMREKKPGQILHKSDNKPIVLGDDYPNLDALVVDLRYLINPIFQGDPDLVALLGSDLLGHYHMRLYQAHGETPSEKQKIEGQQVIQTIGGLPAFNFPGMPQRLAMVTSFSNLSLYVQRGSWRKQVIDNPKRKRVEDYNSRNEGYVVEQYEKVSFVEPAELKFKGET
ncbi:phage major capsid protein, P2 family [Spartinivicinus ruber]|uniref:phage major capsid protein, P2 family n=1 Tax=Spartinivicinus ruber TaxID=2683272 RepID=UPI0013D565AA|nr:phage major capsid protein, P2 family [Spartinivicinus ruber]